MTYAVAYLLLARVILPGYEFLSAYRSRELFRWVREQHRPDLFARLERAGAALGMQPPQVHDAVKAVTRIVLHTGRDVDQLTGQDLHDHRERFYRGQRGADRGVNDAWDLLARIGVLPPGTTLRGSARRGQL